MPRTTILYIAASLDGYIAAPGDDLSFLQLVEREGEDYGYYAFSAGVDTVIMGRKTYDVVSGFGIPFPHADKECYILTRQQREGSGRLHFYNGSVPELISRLKQQPGKTIFCDGGGETAQTLLRLGLLDELILSIIPVLLGGGTRLFGVGEPTGLELLSVKQFPSGLVQLHYAVSPITG